jgi:hypothetical protein
MESIYHHILGVPAPSISIRKELFSFYGFKDDKQVLTIIDVELTDKEAYSMYLELSKKFNLDNCDYMS